MSSRHLASAIGPVPPAQGITGKPGASPRLYGVLRSAAPDRPTRILLETERLLRIYGHGKLTIADVAGACGFSAANVYRYFPSRRAILDALASHYLHEAERTALACAIRNSDSAGDRLSGFLTGLNTALIIFSDFEPRVIALLADATTEQCPATPTMMRASFAASRRSSLRRADPESSGSQVNPSGKPGASRRQPALW
jgi:AcrR family transcriptional regulator